MRQYHDNLIKNGNDFFKERGIDILDVKQRVIRNLLGDKSCLITPSSGLRIVVAHQLTPSQTVLLDRNAVLGFAVDLGGLTSHVAILAKGLEKPAVVGLKNFADQVYDNDLIVVDGNKGIVILNPSKNSLLEYRKIQEKFQHFMQDLVPLKELPAKTLDGQVIELGANIELPTEAESAKYNGAEAIGLFRTEYLYLSKKDFPSEEEQFREYKKVVDSFYPNSVIIRSFDLGGDRLMIRDLKIEEQNPFLGWRSIRISLDLTDIFITQLRAILRTSVRQNVRIMLPMISSIDEVERSKEILNQAMKQLKKENVEFDPRIEVGIMIEVPSAVLIAEHLAKIVDFFSIGTNDLIQYTLAVDRGNERIASRYSSYHPAVLKLIKQTVDVAQQENTWVGLCGEMASDPVMLPFLVGIGLNELSMTPAMIPEIKKIIRSIHYNSAKRIVEDLLNNASGEEVRAQLVQYLNKETPGILEMLIPDSGLNSHNQK
jgi:phosphotransferase system enzyme I (PtsI)